MVVRFIAVISLLLTGFAAPLKARDMEVSIVKDGSPSGTINMLLVRGMGYFQAKEIAGVFGADISYSGKKKQITVSWPDENERKAVFKVGSEYVCMEGIDRKMRKTPFIRRGRIYIPLEAVITRAFENVSRSRIRWDFSRRTLNISYSGNISDTRCYSYEDYTRFVIELSRDLEFDARSSGSMLEITVRKGEPSFEFIPPDIKDGVIKKVEFRKKGPDAVYRIITGSEAGSHKVMKMPGPVRIVVDINRKEAPRSDIEKLPPAPAGPPRREKAALKDIDLVVIDPGHGGKDPGAIGPGGTREKDITLSIAKELAKKIRKKLKIRAVLTRDHDCFIPLSERTELANSRGADVFISVHTNASLNSASRGFEVYFLSEDASDEEAEAVANMENSVVAMEQNPAGMTKVSRILWSLTMNQFMNESSELCSFIHSEVDGDIPVPTRGVKQAGFYVMKGARMPAVLVETAFISNRREEKMLNSRGFQKDMAEAMCEALKGYRKWLRRKN